MRLEISEDGTVLRLAMCLDCARRQPSPFTPVCAGGLPRECLVPSLDLPCSAKFRLFCSWRWTRAQLAPANPGSQKPHKKSFGQCHCVGYTHAHTQRKPNSGTHTSLQYRRLANLDLKTLILN